MINVAFCIDDNFAPYLAVSVASLIKNTDSHVAVNVIGNLSDEVKQALSMLRSDKAEITFVSYDEGITRGELSERYQGRLNGITFVRYALAEILSQLDKVIYLDADILVTGDIKALWEQSLGSNTVGVVEDHSLMSQNRPETIELFSQTYFNAGVMLIDLVRWRENDTFRHLTRVHRSKKEWEYNDQDVLNKVLDGQAQYLNSKFNSQTYTLMHTDVESPVVVHFTGQEKPWHLSSIHPLQSNIGPFLKRYLFKIILCHCFLIKKILQLSKHLKKRLLQVVKLLFGAQGHEEDDLSKQLSKSYPTLLSNRL